MGRQEDQETDSNPGGYVDPSKLAKKIIKNPIPAYVPKTERERLLKEREKLKKKFVQSENKRNPGNKYADDDRSHGPHEGYDDNFDHLADTPETRAWIEQQKKNRAEGKYNMFQNIWAPVNEEKYKYTKEQAGGLSNRQCEEFKKAF